MSFRRPNDAVAGYLSTSESLGPQRRPHQSEPSFRLQQDRTLQRPTEERPVLRACPASSRSRETVQNKKLAPQGTYKEETEFGASHGRVFDRLGLDLLQVTDDGKAVVHAETEKFEQLVHRTESLASLGQREQARWATIDSFDVIPLDLRVDAIWLQHLSNDEPTDLVIELQPVLSRPMQIASCGRSPTYCCNVMARS
jgi:hypothetical protein